LKDVSQTIAYFVSSHGFGHATRSVAIINEIHSENKEFKFIIVSNLPDLFWTNNLQASVDFKNYQVRTDIGFVQTDSFHFDLDETVSLLHKYLEDPTNGLKNLFDFLLKSETCHVICDISPIGIEVAKLLKVKCTLVENFTWDWIYQPLIKKNQKLYSISQRFKNIYDSVDLRIQVKPFCELHPDGVQIEPIHRPFKQPPRVIKAQLGLEKEQDFVLVSTGGIAYQYKCLNTLKDSKQNFVICGDFPKMETNRNVVLLPMNSPFHFPDLVRASTQVVGKVGYGTVIECWAANKKLHGIFRDDFRESEVLKKFIMTEGFGSEITLDQFNSGDWINDLDQTNLWVKKSKTNGNRIAAQEIMEQISSGFGLPLNKEETKLE
tara:strand:- start:780 stop:1913 length:1134 start_codon:yes stop_codon:yes gene_type:complete